MKPIPVSMDDVVSELVRVSQAEILLLGPKQWMERITGLRVTEHDNQTEEPGVQFISDGTHEDFVWVNSDNTEYFVFLDEKADTPLRDRLRNALREAYEAETL